MTRRSKQTHHCEGGVGIRVFAIDSKTRNGNCNDHSYALSLRIQYSQRRGRKAPVAQADLPGSHAVPVAKRRWCQLVNLWILPLQSRKEEDAATLWDPIQTSMYRLLDILWMIVLFGLRL